MTIKIYNSHLNYLYSSNFINHFLLSASNVISRFDTIKHYNTAYRFLHFNCRFEGLKF